MKKIPPPIQNCIRSLRETRNGMTQQELADLVNVTRHTIMAIEAAKYSPSLEVAFKISEVFNLPLEEVFQYKNTVS